MEAEIVEMVSRSLVGRKAVTKEELIRRIIRASLDVLREDLKNLSYEKIEELALSLLDEPLSVKSLHFPEELEIGGVKFYHPHTEDPTAKDIETAYEEFLRSKKFLESLEAMRDVMDDFFDGYSGTGEFFRVYEGRKRYGVFFTTIDDADEDADVHAGIARSFEGEYVLCVPTEDEITPFLRFFRRHSEDFKRSGVKVWVVNVEDMCVDPFIGYPRDLSLIRRFRNPRVATLVNSLWRVHVDSLD
ncbi:MAG: hypothetical protein ABWW66_01650 [Archaeoglobaceae archaeon]